MLGDLPLSHSLTDRSFPLVTLLSDPFYSLEHSLASLASNSQMPVAHSPSFPTVPTKVSPHTVKCLPREGRQTLGEMRPGNAEEGVSITDLSSFVEFVTDPALDLALKT